MVIHNSPVFETERLVLRIPSVHDIAGIISCADDPGVASGTRLPFPFTEVDAVDWLNRVFKGRIEKNRYVFAIEERQGEKFCGGIGLHLDELNNMAEVGYWLGRRFWNKGYASEAIKPIIHFAFTELKLNKVFATHYLHNPSSGRVLEKAGFVKEGILKQHVKRSDEFLDVVYYGLLRSNFS